MRYLSSNIFFVAVALALVLPGSKADALHLDPNFGVNGSVSIGGKSGTTLIGADNDPNDRSLYVSYLKFSDVDGTWRLAVDRVTSKGTVDPTFQVEPNLLGSDYALQPAVWILPRRDGKLYWVAREGTYEDTTTSQICLLHPSGFLDRLFGDQGCITADVWAFWPSVDRRDRLLLPHAKVIFKHSMRVLAIAPSGEIDRQFGREGIISTGLSAIDQRLEILDDGGFYAYGRAYEGDEAATPIYRIERYEQDGRLRSTYGGNGRVDQTRSEWFGNMSNCKSTESGGIFYSGFSADFTDSDDAAFYVSRRTASGVLDESFGVAGWLSQPHPGQYFGFSCGINFNSELKAPLNLLRLAARGGLVSVVEAYSADGKRLLDSLSLSIDPRENFFTTDRLFIVGYSFGTVQVTSVVLQ